MRKAISTFVITLLIILVIGLAVFFTCTPAGVTVWNNWFHAVQKADDDTNYKTRKQVEDTCRSMVASYNSDKLTYEQYKDSDNEEKQSWAEQAKMRANKTVSSYNEYVLKNSYIWENNVPSDIKFELPYLQ